MEFREDKAIYLQIAEYVCEHILLSNWKADQKIPSVREMAVNLEVNPNTVMRTYELLQQKNIILNKRGVGFFVAENALEQVRDYRKTAFMEEELPQVFRNMYLLNIGFDEIEPRYKSYVKNTFNYEAK